MEISYDENTDILTIDGIRYSGLIFKTFVNPSNKVYSFCKNDNGAINVYQYNITGEELEEVIIEKRQKEMFTLET